MASKLLLVAACFALADSQKYSYDRCSSTGPQNWASLPGSKCGGLQQTPIDLCGAVPFPPKPGRREDDEDDEKKNRPKYGYTLKGYDEEVQLTITNPGNSVLVNGAMASTFAPGLHQLVGRNPSDTVSNPEWVFAQMHIHWGRDGNPNEGSEHAMAGLRYAAEAHFVHFNKARGNTIGEAVASGKNDALLVIGAFLQQGPAEKETELIRVLTSYVPKLESAPQKTIQMREKLVLGDLIDPKGAFYSYGGGLTTPGCVEIVTWIVQAKPYIISVESLELLKTAIDAQSGVPISKFGNFRPLLPLNGRKLYLSKGVSPQCSKVVLADTIYKCSASASMSAATSDATPAETTSSSTPTWVWIVIGVALPGTALLAVIGTLYYASWRQRQVSADENVVFTPLPELREVQLANSVDVEAVRNL